MPLIRLARDRRGLDTLYLLQQRPDARGETRLKVIYFCAAPQGLAFGRRALDEATQRGLEQRYPDVAFDWPALLKDVEQRRLPPATDPMVRRGRDRGGKAERRAQPSEVPTEKDKGPGGKRKRRRPGSGGTSPSQAEAPIIK